MSRFTINDLKAVHIHFSFSFADFSEQRRNELLRVLTTLIDRVFSTALDIPEEMRTFGSKRVSFSPSRKGFTRLEQVSFLKVERKGAYQRKKKKKPPKKNKGKKKR